MKQQPRITDKQKREFYASLMTKTFTEAVCAFGWDKIYTNNSTLRAKGYQMYKSIVPEKLGIAPEIVEQVKNSIENRRVRNIKIVEKTDDSALLDPEDTKSVIIGGRNKAAMLLHKKMDRMGRNKKLLDAVSLTQLATTFGILFDKSQILRGEATENIASMSKITIDMSPTDTLDALLKNRESRAEIGVKGS